MVFGQTPTITSTYVNYAIAQITINGTNFGTTGTVYLSDTELVIASWAATKIVAQLPSTEWMPGTYLLTVHMRYMTASLEVSLAPRTIHGSVPGGMAVGHTFTATDGAYKAVQPEELGIYNVTFTHPFEAPPDCIITASGVPLSQYMPAVFYCYITASEPSYFSAWCGTISNSLAAPSAQSFSFLCAESE